MNYIKHEIYKSEDPYSKFTKIFQELVVNSEEKSSDMSKIN